MNDDENIIAFLRGELDKTATDEFLQDELRRLMPAHANRDNKITVMPFGKHRGRRIDSIPHEYLAWVLNNCDGLKPELRRAILSVLGCENY